MTGTWRADVEKYHEERRLSYNPHTWYLEAKTTNRSFGAVEGNRGEIVRR